MALDIALAATVSKVALKSLLEKLGSEAAKNAGAHARGMFERWQTERTLKSISDRNKQIRKVKTIFQIEKELDLVKFYYPSKIKSNTEPAKVVQRLADFTFDGNLVVRGIVGQGKSVFLRYLTACELEIGERIPVFIELRRLAPGQSVMEAALEEMKNLGLEGVNREIVDYLAESSRLALLLDGFDEVPEEQVPSLVRELEEISVRAPRLRIVVTSRPENAIERSPHFRVFDLAPLGPGEYAKVLARIVDQARAEEIVSNVGKSRASIVSLLTTPLMVSLLAVRYQVGQGIPENRVAFYEPLFMLLLQRHDAAKAGYRRTRKSKLSDAQLLNFFNCLCFVTRRDRVSVLREHVLHGAAARALKWVNLEAHPPDPVIEDIRSITCLILRDGLDEYRFLHKSVQEFHAACFVRDQQDALSSDFYAAMRQHWSEWEQELQFLMTIHQDRYDRYFAIPMLDQVVSTLVGASAAELGRALLARLTVRVMLRPQPEFQNIVYPRDPVGWCLMNYFDGSGLFEGIGEASVRVAKGRAPSDAQSGFDFCDIAGRDVLAALAPSHHSALDVEAEALGRRIVADLSDRRRRMHMLDERKGLFDI